jgi:transposase-like protein
VPKANPVDPSELTSSIAKHFSDEEAAWGLVERLRWPGGPVCPHCGVVNNATYIAPKSGFRRTRADNFSYRRIWQCREAECARQFSVLVGTVMEDSHIPLRKWLLAMRLLCNGKNGVSAHGLHRALGITYKSAWFMAHRIRYAMEMTSYEAKLTETVEVDETYLGAKAETMHKRQRAERITERGRLDKVPVVTLVERGGQVRPQARHTATGENIAKMHQPSLAAVV